MEWTQSITLGITLIAYMTGMCMFFYRLNEASIKEWREEHTNQIKEWREEHTNQMKEWREEHTSQMKESKKEWREMFIYMNDRVNAVQSNKNN